MKNILFVDDEPLVLEGLNRLLRPFRTEWCLRFAYDGSEAIRIAHEEEVDIIISDIRMPNMSGLEMLAEIQKSNRLKNIPVVILTGDQEHSLKRRALDLGAVDLLSKPINREDLVARINNVLRLKEVQDTLLRKNDELKNQLIISQKMELVGIMAAGAIHDLKNLLSIIIGYSNLFIDDESIRDEDLQNIDRIRRAGEKASELVSQILKFTRQNDGNNQVNMETLVGEVLSILEVITPKDIKIQWCKSQQDLIVEASSIKVQQVLMNLLINGIQAMKGKGVLKVNMTESQGKFARVDICDTGIGMDEPSLEKIYDPLFTTKEVGQGSGLGLFVVKHIIDEYGGKIEVDSRLGEGCQFSVFFPLLEK